MTPTPYDPAMAVVETTLRAHLARLSNAELKDWAERDIPKVSAIAACMLRKRQAGGVNR